MIGWLVLHVNNQRNILPNKVASEKGAQSDGPCRRLHSPPWNSCFSKPQGETWQHRRTHWNLRWGQTHWDVVLFEELRMRKHQEPQLCLAYVCQRTLLGGWLTVKWLAVTPRPAALSRHPKPQLLLMFLDKWSNASVGDLEALVRKQRRTAMLWVRTEGRLREEPVCKTQGGLRGDPPDWLTHETPC